MFGEAKLKLLISLADQTSSLTPVGVAKANAKRPAKEFGKVRRFKVGRVELGDLFDETSPPQAPEALSPPADGTLSYNALSDRLLVLNIPGHVIELSADTLKWPACPGPCSQLQDSRAANTADVKTLTTDGFALGRIPLRRARIDTLFRGSVAMPEPPSTTAPVYFQGRPIINAAAVVRPEKAFWPVGVDYDSAIGLAVLSTGVYAFDFRSMKMWRYQ
ncbi:MAG: hypothetical protein ACJ74Y_09940 [Bryobacteraceae bacterium]